MDSCDRIGRSKICDVRIRKHKWMWHVAVYEAPITPSYIVVCLFIHRIRRS